MFKPNHLRVKFPADDSAAVILLRRLTTARKEGTRHLSFEVTILITTRPTSTKLEGKTRARSLMDGKSSFEVVSDQLF